MTVMREPIFTAPAGTSTMPDDLTGEPRGFTVNPDHHTHTMKSGVPRAVTLIGIRRDRAYSFRADPAARDTDAAPSCAMMGNSQMLDVMDTGMLREWVTHHTAQLPLLLAATATLLVAGASAHLRRCSVCAAGGTLTGELSVT